MKVLYSEILYITDDVVIYKTYDQIMDRYGMHSVAKTGEKTHKAVYLYIFPYGKYHEESRAVAVTDVCGYVWLSLKGEILPMSEEEESIFQNCLHKNSFCFCAHEYADTPCITCNDSGQITNRYVDVQNGFLFYQWNR